MKSKYHSTSGNILLYVLIGIVLFAALMFVLTRENRYDTGSTENAALNAQQITSYAEKVNSTVQNLIMQNHCLPTKISFENSIVSGYTNGANKNCQIFDQTGKGGGLTFETPPAAAIDTAAATAAGSSLGGNYAFEGNVVVTNAGTSDGSLIFVMPFVTQAVCAQINQITSGSTTIPTVSADAFDGTKFTGTFAATFTLTTSGTTGTSGCFQSASYKPGAGYHFYSVLVAN